MRFKARPMPFVFRTFPAEKLSKMLRLAPEKRYTFDSRVTALVALGEPSHSALGSVHDSIGRSAAFSSCAPLLRRCSMGSRIYVGNLHWSTTYSELQNMFAEHGGVKNAEVIS